LSYQKIQSSHSTASRARLHFGLLSWVLTLLAIVCLHAVSRAAQNPLSNNDTFVLGTIIDFPDVVTSNDRPLTAKDLDTLIAKLAAIGFRRLSWSYYSDGRGGFLSPTGYQRNTKGGGTITIRRIAASNPSRSRSKPVNATSSLR